MTSRYATAAALLAALAGTASTSLAQSTNPFPAQYELSSLNGTDGFVINGIAAGDLLGTSVSSAGDVNGDGIDDFIIGAAGASQSGISHIGVSYVVFGDLNVGSSGVFDLSSLNGSNGFVLIGIDERDFSGKSCSSAGDVNGDGIDDLIIGAYGADPNGSLSGESYVVFGGPAVGSSGAIDLSSLNGTNGFVINGFSKNNFSGVSVSSACDFNGDGFDDFIIGAESAGPAQYSYEGESFVLFGGPGVGSSGTVELAALTGTDGFALIGIDTNDRSGHSVSSAGDVNDDGINDLVIGAFWADPNGDSSGESYVVFGGPAVGVTGTFELSSLNGSNGFVLNGIDADDRSGRSVSSAGDVNGDGIDDIIIAAHFADPNGDKAGECYVVFGGPVVGCLGTVELSSLNGNNGFVLNGIDAGDYSGWAVSSAGDVNADGIDDLVIGARNASPNVAYSGQSYVVFGRAISADLDGDGLSESEETALGTDPLNADTDGDGVTDGAEVNVLGTDPTLEDSDADGVSDLLDKCHGGDDTLGADGDGIPDACDATPACPADMNGDGFLDSGDIAIFVPLFLAGC